MDCTLAVPANPLSAKGLSTPYQLGGCHEADPNASAFVEASVYNPVTNGVSVYRPLVVDEGDDPAVPPVVPVIPPNAVVGIWFGFNGNNLHLTGPGADWCINGLGDSIFGQFAYCNAPRFFAAAAKVVTPPIGIGLDGQPCPTTRSFTMVDQDQSDNVVTSYRALPNGQIAQNTTVTANMGTVLKNGSDNGLLDGALDPALGCKPATGPDLADPGKRVPSLALNELSAAQHQQAPVALVPPGDPMVKIGDKVSYAKTRLYRLGVGQPLRVTRDATTVYCQNLTEIAPAEIALDKQFTVAVPNPVAGSANLFDFLTTRLAATQQMLGCG